MKKILKPFAMILLLGMTFLSGSARSLQIKAANAEPPTTGMVPGAGGHGGSCD